MEERDLLNSNEFPQQDKLSGQDADQHSVSEYIATDELYEPEHLEPEAANESPQYTLADEPDQ